MISPEHDKHVDALIREASAILWRAAQLERSAFLDDEAKTLEFYSRELLTLSRVPTGADQ